MTQTAPPVAAGGVAIVRRPRRLRALWFLVAIATLGALIVISVMIGSRDVSWADAVAVLGGSTNGFDEAAVAKRIPRTFLAVAVGAALGVSGAVMQGVTRNPLADPGILGVNMGASLAVVTGIAYFGLTSASSFIWVAITGAALAAVFVYVVGSLGRGGATPLKLALAGAATSAALASFVTAIILPRGDISQSARSWQIGGVGGGTWDSISQVLPFLLVGFLISLASAKGLNSLALGDDLAAGLGERVAMTRGAAALGAVVLCGAATAVTGPIAFVGLVVPHACRLMFGVDHRWVLPFSAVVGASLLTGADVLGRILTRPSEIDVGIITAIIGAPIFIWIVRRSKVRAL
ncbi:FecCD family ABC transporter permease [Pseudoclavibacter helvolus]|uniref:Iron complex transport system permease protein n=1 Tax=Pseudoclavibacter helvolus TaxID=255205 RepID=A0A7W4YE88_9MICO|nr:iron complex transport system permease protein [Pseudoclavibacter helvolus]